MGYVTGGLDWVADHSDRTGGWWVHNLGGAGWVPATLTSAVSGAARFASGLVGLADVQGVYQNTVASYNAYRAQGVNMFSSAGLSIPLIGGMIADIGHTFQSLSLRPHDFGSRQSGLDRATSIASTISLVGAVGAGGLARAGVNPRLISAERAAGMILTARLHYSALTGRGIIRSNAPSAASMFFSPQAAIVANVARAAVRSDLARHIRYRDATVPRSKGIGGAHNLNEFMFAARAEGIRITSITPHPQYAGISKMAYQIRALDRAGNPTGSYKATIFEKTVYNPKIISDFSIYRLGREAADDALGRGLLTREWLGAASNGMWFRGYLDSNGLVRSFFPEFY